MNPAPMNLAPPLVGITACIKQQALAQSAHGYVDALLLGAGARPLSLPALADARAIARMLDLLDGVLLTGCAAQYPLPDALPTGMPAATNVALIRAAVQQGVPVLGICAGLQELNLAFGGSLQPASAEPSAPESLSVRVVLEPGGMLQTLLEGCSELVVKRPSLAPIARLGAGLCVEASAADGCVEALRVTGARAFALAVQWHPEGCPQTEPASQQILTAQILTAFSAACAERASRRSTQDQRQASGLAVA